MQSHSAVALYSDALTLLNGNLFENSKAMQCLPTIVQTRKRLLFVDTHLIVSLPSDALITDTFCDFHEHISIVAMTAYPSFCFYVGCE